MSCGNGSRDGTHNLLKHSHDFLGRIYIPHLKLKLHKFCKVARRGALLCTEGLRNSHHALKRTHHNLFVELAGSRQECLLSIVVRNFKDSRPTFCVSTYECRCLELGKAFYVKRIAECFEDSCLHGKDVTVSSTSKRKGTVIKTCLKREVFCIFIKWNLSSV